MRLTLDLFGVVQGVGLRPTVSRLATRAGLGGWVENRSGSVRLCLMGPAPQVEEFVAALPSQLPGPARIDRVERLAEQASVDGSGLPFKIKVSSEDSGDEIVLPADLAVCDACLAEVMAPDNRRFGYPFTTCTLCGPRYTVVNGVPYDRERTTLRQFPLCDACQAEYDDADNRRYHAESIACPHCGPRLVLCTADGAVVSDEPLRDTRVALASGQIVAIRGIGGFLLAADALNRVTVARLRQRKARPHKPLAVMAADLAAAQRFCRIPAVAAQLLCSAVAPIVVLEAEAASRAPVDLLTPDAPTLGVMLPTSPLHYLLCTPLPGDPTPRLELLVMTSGNRAGEPICVTNREARERLAGIADLFLCHDREINLRCDDSVCIVHQNDTFVWRRARGFAPAPLRLAKPLRRPVLAMGAELKNTVAVGYRNQIVLSPHIGDLATPEALAALERTSVEVPAFLRQQPEVVAVDLHPDMQSTRLGHALAVERGLEVVTVQHHHAHAEAVMAEHHLDEALALVFDGAGLGADGEIWGAELLWVQRSGFTRLGTFAGVPLPGGDAAVRRPVRQLVARFWDAGVKLTGKWRLDLGLSDHEVVIWQQQCAQRLNSPLSHAAGRLFDAMAVVLGLAPREITYEAQAAIRLERAASTIGFGVAPLPYSTSEIDGQLVIDWRPTFRHVAQNAEPREEVAAAFHVAVAEAAKRMAIFGRERTGQHQVVLAGGVFSNRLLLDILPALLAAAGFAVFLPRQLPVNDGAVAVGQILVAGGY